MKTQKRTLKTLDFVRPDGYGKSYRYWKLENRENYIVGDCGIVNHTDVKYKRIAVRTSDKLWYILDPAMHTEQYNRALSIIKSREGDN